jgi:hypothetical protein
MGLFPSLARPTVGPQTHCKLGLAALPCPEPIEYPIGNIGLVEFLLSLPKQDKEELMILVGMNPTEWDLPKQDKEELMMLLGMSAKEWEKCAHEARERLAEAERVRLRLTVSSASESEQAQPKTSSFGRLVAALR